MLENLEIIKHIKKNNEKLFNEIKKNNISKNEIDKNEILLRRFIEQDPKSDYQIKLYFIDGKIIETMSKKMTEKNKKEKFKKNYLFPLLSENQYNYSLSKNFIKSEERNELANIFKNLLLNKGEKKWIWIYGSFGVGKTFSSICLLNKFAEQNLKVGFVLFPELVTKISASISNSFNENNENMFRILEKLKKLDVLLLDDVGSEKNSSWFRDNFLFPLLNYRMENKYITIFTSNISISEYSFVLNQSKTRTTKLEKISSERIINRITKTAVEFNLKGEDYRN